MIWPRLSRGQSMNTELRISTNTNLLAFSSDGHRTMDEIIPMLSKAGFRYADLNFCEMMNPKSELNTDNVFSYIERIREIGRTCNVSFIQSHVPYPQNYTALDEDGKAKSDEAILKALSFSKSLGIPVAVIHPIKGSIKENIDYFSSILGKHEGNITIAIENMETKDEINSVDELLQIVDALSGRAGICLDTGHAHMCGHSIPDFIHRAGDYLIATHIADNNGHKDEHLLPFFGTIDWESAMKAFNESYKGYLNYECMYFGKAFPQKSGEAIASLSYDIANLLLSLS